MSISVALFLHLSYSSSLDVMVSTTDHVVNSVGGVSWTEGVCSVAAQYSGVHGGVIALDDSFDAEALAMAMKIPQHLHDVSNELLSLCLTHSTSHPLQVWRTVKLEFSALLAVGTIVKQFRGESAMNVCCIIVTNSLCYSHSSLMVTYIGLVSIPVFRWASLSLQ